MGKRSTFERRPRDWYPTPPEAVVPLLPHLEPGTDFIEPCAGDGALVGELERAGHVCVWALDIEPQAPGIQKLDALQFTNPGGASAFITNPPWPMPGKGGDPVISLILHFITMAPTWLLLPFDFAANRYFAKVADHCERIVPIGRVSWEGNGIPGKDNAAWFLFSKGPNLTILEARR